MREGEMQSEEVGFQSAFERGQHLGCSDIHRKVIHHRGARTESSRERAVQV